MSPPYLFSDQFKALVRILSQYQLVGAMKRMKLKKSQANHSGGRNSLADEEEVSQSEMCRVLAMVEETEGRFVDKVSKLEKKVEKNGAVLGEMLPVLQEIRKDLREMRQKDRLLSSGSSPQVSQTSSQSANMVSIKKESIYPAI